MHEIGLVLRTLLAYYRRHPGQALFLLVGLAIGSLMLTGIHTINEQARSSYADADRRFGQRELYRVEPVQSNGTVPQSLYVTLRRHGIDQALPVVEAPLILPRGERLWVTGIDPLALPSEEGDRRTWEFDLAAFALPPYEGLVGRSRAASLGLRDGQTLALTPSLSLGRLRVVDDDALIGSRLVVDIGLAQALAERPDRLSFIALFDLSQRQRDWLAGQLTPGLRLTATDRAADLEQLTASFHLNLTAMSLLAFVVGLFIVYNAVNYTVLHRRELIARLRLLGVARRPILAALYLELAAWVVLGAAIGFALGLALARALGPPVADTLGNLYGAEVGATGHWRWSWFLEAQLMTLAGATLAAGRRLTQLGSTAPVRAQGLASERQWSRGDRTLQRRLALIALSASAILGLAGSGLVAAFLVIAGVLLAAALVLPGLLQEWLAWLRRRRAQGALGDWLLADADARMTRLGVAMMAFLLAMASNVGINTVVGSFRATFVDWLDQRLTADVYLRPGAEEVVDWRTVLEGLPAVERVTGYRETETPVAGRPGEVIGMDIDTLRQTQVLKTALPDVWRELAGGAVLINEKLALARGLRPGQPVSLTVPAGAVRRTVAGIVYDYGNPRYQVLVDERQWRSLWPGVPPRSLGVYWRDGQAMALEQLQAELAARPAQLIDQASVKALSVAIFERTFAITASMNALTLLVAAIGLFCALLAMGGGQLRQLAILQSLGVSQRRLLAAGLLQVLLITGLTLLMAVPLGIALAWLLINQVNVAAFGWTFPLRLFPADYASLAAATLAAASVAAAWPAWRQSRSSCRRWLQEASA